MSTKHKGPETPQTGAQSTKTTEKRSRIAPVADLAAHRKRRKLQGMEAAGPADDAELSDESYVITVAGIGVFEMDDGCVALMPVMEPGGEPKRGYAIPVELAGRLGAALLLISEGGQKVTGKGKKKR
jgi:hypothetical protein